MIGRNHALLELLHFFALQRDPKFRLAKQKTLQQRPFGMLEIGQHAQLFHRARRQILRFVHHQKRALALLDDGEQIALEFL